MCVDSVCPPAGSLCDARRALRRMRARARDWQMSSSSDAAPARKSTSRLQTAVRSILSGTVAGIACKCLEYPLDTVKVRLQTQ